MELDQKITGIWHFATHNTKNVADNLEQYYFMNYVL